MTMMILIIDDDEWQLRLLELILNRAGYEVLIALSGEEAFNIISLRTPDIILLDYMMPGMNGIEVCKRLRSLGSTASIPIVFVSSLSDARSMEEGLQAGANEFLTKPIVPALLTKHIENLLIQIPGP